MFVKSFVFLAYLSYAVVAVRRLPCQRSQEDRRLSNFVDSVDRASRITRIEQRLQALNQLLLRQTSEEKPVITKEALDTFSGSLGGLNTQVKHLTQQLQSATDDIRSFKQSVREELVKINLKQSNLSMSLSRTGKMITRLRSDTEMSALKMVAKIEETASKVAEVELDVKAMGKHVASLVKASPERLELVEGTMNQLSVLVRISITRIEKLESQLKPNKTRH